MTTRINHLKSKIDALYQAENPERADWADWLYENHVYVVAEYSREIAERFGARAELSEAAGMLHDIADAVMSRENPEHAERSVALARELLQESGFSDEEIAIVVDDAIRLHSCHGADAPQTLEGKAMATGDALGHLKNNFYDQAIQIFKDRGESEEDICEWGRKKVERDYHKKIFFDEVRTETTADYERVKALFMK